MSKISVFFHRLQIHYLIQFARPPLSFFHLKIIYDKNREVLENAIATEAE